MANCFTNGRPKTGEPILTICTSYDVLLQKEVPLGGRCVTAPNLGGKIPQNHHLGVNRRLRAKRVKHQHLHACYRKYCIDSNQILHSNKDHQIPFVGGPNTRITTCDACVRTTHFKRWPMRDKNAADNLLARHGQRHE